MYKTTNIFGYNFICDAQYSELAEEIVSMVKNRNCGLINMVTPNAHFINTYSAHPALRAFCQASKYVLPDGQPIVWLSRFTAHPIRRRLTGSDFFPVIFEKLIDPRFKALFVVSDEAVAEGLKQKKPDGTYFIPPFFELNQSALIDSLCVQLAELIIKSQLQFVFVGISDPKQGALVKGTMERLRASGHFPSCAFFGFGASYQFYLGMKKRAPNVFRNTGLEWLYRLVMEPKRMFRRYVFGNVAFIRRSVSWLINERPR